MNGTQPLLAVGRVMHRRLRPRVHAFEYPTRFVLLPMRAMRARPAGVLARNRFGVIGFHDADHGDGRGDALAWAEQVLADAGVGDADGEVWLQTYPRLLGSAFKPVSFWYCLRRDGTLAAILVEVNNTFGERHGYLLAGRDLGWGRTLRASKVLHVSPFCEVRGEYRFRFMHGGGRIVARIEYDDGTGPLLVTSVSGQLQPLTERAARATLFASAWLAWAVIVRIHLQALRLWLKRVPLFPKPPPPAPFISSVRTESTR